MITLDFNGSVYIDYNYNVFYKVFEASQFGGMGF